MNIHHLMNQYLCTGPPPHTGPPPVISGIPPHSAPPPGHVAPAPAPHVNPAFFTPAVSQAPPVVTHPVSTNPNTGLCPVRVDTFGTK